MSLLRIRASLADAPLDCQWALLDVGSDVVVGAGRLADLPRRAERVQLVIPAAQVLITRVHLPQGARRHAGSVLAYAVEDETVGEPDANQVTRIGALDDDDVLAVVDKQGLSRWRHALDAVGIHGYEVQCEALLLPWSTGEWNLVWNGREGFVRSGEFEAAATDCGDRETPPLSLRLMLDAAQAHNTVPTSIALYATAPDAVPDIDAWTRALGIAVRSAGNWDWRTAPASAGVCLSHERQPWRALAEVAARLRPAAWILGAALAIQATALVIDWASLANEERALRWQMESQFRAAFPDAVAVADPALQMRRKLAEARHAVGQSDGGDFLSLIGHVAAAVKELPVGAVRAVSYAGGRMTLELAAGDEARARLIVSRLLQSGLSVDTSAAAPRAPGATVVLIVGAS